MYLVRKKVAGEYEVANFVDHKNPDAVYTVKKTKCSCPAAWGKRSCKHISLVNKFKSLGEGSWWFEFNNGEIIPHRIVAFD